MKLEMIERPLESRRCKRTFRLWKRDPPALSFCITTPLLELLLCGNCGKGTSSCAALVVDPFNVVPGSRLNNGLGTVAERALIALESRASDVLRYCRGT